jgi:hypothetical protein
VAYWGLFLGEGEFNKFSWGQREWGSGGGSPLVGGFHSICKWMKTVFWLGCWMWNWEFSSALSKVQNFGGVLILPGMPLVRLLLIILGFSVLLSPFHTSLHTSSAFVQLIKTVRTEFWVSKCCIAWLVCDSWSETSGAWEATWVVSSFGCGHRSTGECQSLRFSEAWILGHFHIYIRERLACLKFGPIIHIQYGTCSVPFHSDSLTVILEAPFAT